MSDYQSSIQALNILAWWDSLSLFTILSRPMSTIMPIQLQKHLVTIMEFLCIFSVPYSIACFSDESLYRRDLWPRCTCLWSFQFLSEGPIPIFFDVTRQPTSPRTLVNGFAYILSHRYDFLSLVAALFHIYDVVNELVLDHNFSCSIQKWSIFWPTYSSDW